jgi:hypothetical protein
VTDQSLVSLRLIDYVPGYIPFLYLHLEFIRTSINSIIGIIKIIKPLPVYYSLASLCLRLLLLSVHPSTYSMYFIFSICDSCLRYDTN